MTNPAVPEFYGKPIDTPTGHRWAGHFDPNVCIGYETAEHPHPEADLRPSFLCPACDDRLNGKVAADREAAYVARSSITCPAGDHPRGSRYYDCMACYGD